MLHLFSNQEGHSHSAAFSCEITIKPKNKEYAPITAVYRIDVTPGSHSKFISIRKKKNWKIWDLNGWFIMFV